MLTALVPGIDISMLTALVQGTTTLTWTVFSAGCFLFPSFLQVYPDKGTVSFSAGLHAWAFTLTTFAQMYAAKFGTDESKMMEKLWGDNFFDPATKKWTKKATDSKTCQRGFVQFCYNPIKQVREGCNRG